jgi:hypothetical protein
MAVPVARFSQIVAALRSLEVVGVRVEDRLEIVAGHASDRDGPRSSG